MMPIFVPMLRIATTILLLAAFGAQTFQSSLLVLSYYLDKEAYSKDCENRFRPQMHCNGQCLLMKKLRDQETKEQQLPERKQETKNEAFSSTHFFATRVDFPAGRLSLLHPDLEPGAVVHMPRFCFH